MKFFKEKSVKNFSSLQFTLFRIIFGFYLLIHFIDLLPFAADIWSSKGMLADSTLNFTYGFFPNVLVYFNSPFEIELFIVIMMLLSLLILTGFYRRMAAILLWIGWASLFHQNNLISNPSIAMVGWLLLALVLIPINEPLSYSHKSEKEWSMPYIIFWGAWVISAFAYTLSGLDKLLSPSWQDGTAIIHLLNNPLSREWMLVDFLRTLPEWILHLQTWFALVLEISFGFLAFFSRTRALAWFMVLAMHISILLVVDFADLTLGVLMLHLFIFDSSWFQPKTSKEKSVVLFDGVCIFCNDSINFLIEHDKYQRFHFTPLQGEFAKSLDLSEELQDLNSIVFYHNQKIYTRSKAIILILRQLGGMWVFLLPLLFIPQILLDLPYNLIAKNRYRFFGKKEQCMMPSEEIKKRFLG